MKIPLFKMSYEKADSEAVDKVLKRASYWATGPEIDQFEKAIAKYVGTDYCAVFNSGTSALHSMLMMYGIGKGDEVIIPSFTFIATANACLMVGAKPVFADIESTTYGLDIESVESMITEKTKAIMPIHYAGCPCKDIGELEHLANDYGLLLFEDAAQSLGASIDGQKVGTFGECNMFSGCQDKMISCFGEGGILVTNDNDIYEKLKLIRSHGRADNDNYFDSIDVGKYIALGYNYRMPTVCATLGLSQLNRIEKLIAKRQQNAKHYIKQLKGIVDVPVIPEGFKHVFQKFTIQSDKRDDIQKHLLKNEIYSKAYFGTPVHLTKFYKEIQNHKKETLPETERLAKRVLSLPMFPDLEKEQIDIICTHIKEVIE